MEDSKGKRGERIEDLRSAMADFDERLGEIESDPTSRGTLEKIPGTGFLLGEAVLILSKKLRNDGRWPTTGQISNVIANGVMNRYWRKIFFPYPGTIRIEAIVKGIRTLWTEAVNMSGEDKGGATSMVAARRDLIAQTFEDMKRDRHYSKVFVSTVNRLKHSVEGPTVDHVCLVLRRKFENADVWPTISMLTDKTLDEYFHDANCAREARSLAMRIWEERFIPVE